MITTKQVRATFDYDATTGDLLWKERTGRKAKIGARAGCRHAGRYVTIRTHKINYYAHRLVWLWHGRELPKIIDHINLNKHDNRIENLRAVTPSQSQFNHPRRVTNTSGAKGVSWCRSSKKWQVRLLEHGRAHYFGVFDDFELAELVAIEARELYHGQYARQQ